MQATGCASHLKSMTVFAGQDKFGFDLLDSLMLTYRMFIESRNRLQQLHLGAESTVVGVVQRSLVGAQFMFMKMPRAICLVM